MDWFGLVIHEYYSSTEGGGVYVGPRDWPKKAGTVSKARWRGWRSDAG